MKVRVITSETFRKKTKRLLKKYPSLKNELLLLEKQLIEKPESGISLGNNCYKIRIAVKSKGKGKRGGIRVITHIIIRLSRTVEELKIVGLVTIFDKSEYANLKNNELIELIAEIKDLTSNSNKD